MSLESGTYIDSLVVTNPTASDPKSQGDDHLRLIKSAIKNTLPSLTGPVTATQAELNLLDGATVTTAEINILDGVTSTASEINILDGVTVTYDKINYLSTVSSDVQTQINTLTTEKATLASPTFTGTVVLPSSTSIDTVSATEITYLNGVTSAIQTQIDTLTTVKAPLASPALTGNPTAPTQTAADNSTKIATTAMVQTVAMNSALPLQTGNNGKYLITDGTNSSWAGVSAGLYPTAKSSGFTAGISDDKSFYRSTGTFTIAIDAAATAGDGWQMWVENVSTGIITIDPNGSETADGLTAINILPNEVRVIVCDGAGFYSVVVRPFYQSFSSGGSFVKPLSGYSRVAGEMWAAGGGGGKGNTTAGAAGGGGGACVPFDILLSEFSASETVTIGAGGAGATSVGSVGSVGGNSSVGSVITVYGGGGGGGLSAAGNVTGGGGGGALSAGGVGGASDGTGGAPVNIGTSNSGHGGAPGRNILLGKSQYGGAGGGGTQTATPTGGGDSFSGGGGGGGVGSTGSIQAGGSSVLGGNGGTANDATSGAVGTIPAGGGGATRTGTAGGAGANGRLNIWGTV